MSRVKVSVKPAVEASRDDVLALIDAIQDALDECLTTPPAAPLAPLPVPPSETTSLIAHARDRCCRPLGVEEGPACPVYTAYRVANSGLSPFPEGN